MAFTTVLLAGDAYTQLRNGAVSWKAQAQNALSFMGTNPIDSTYAFALLDQLRGLVTNIATLTAVPGLNTYATAQGYPGTMTTDAAAISTAATSCIAWVVTNFPTSAGFLQAFKLNADGSRLATVFTPTQTAGLQTALSAFVASIG